MSADRYVPPWERVHQNGEAARTDGVEHGVGSGQVTKLLIEVWGEE